MAQKLLIAAGEAGAGPERLPPAIRSLIDEAGEILVIAPRLPSRLEWLSSDTDRATEQADERLQAVLGHLEEIGAPASGGAVGADDPLVAFEDAVRAFQPDHILVGLRQENRAGWQEQGLLERIEERFSIPMTVFQLPG